MFYEDSFEINVPDFPTMSASQRGLRNVNDIMRSEHRPEAFPRETVKPSAMKATTIYLVGLSDEPLALARSAAEAAFPSASIFSFRSVADALRTGETGRLELLVLSGADAGEIGLATQATVADDRPRWAVIVLGHGPSDLADMISPEACRPAVLAQLLRSVVMQHELLRENLQLRGDLKTIARRLNHDLRSPLNCLNLNCELIDELLDADAAEVRSQVGVIRKSLGEIGQLIERYSEILLASTDPAPATDVAMDAVVACVLRQFEQEGIAVQQPPAWPRVRGVAEWLEIIWWNLISNALKHGSPGAPIGLGWRNDGDALRFLGGESWSRGAVGTGGRIVPEVRPVAWPEPPWRRALPGSAPRFAPGWSLRLCPAGQRGVRVFLHSSRRRYRRGFAGLETSDRVSPGLTPGARSLRAASSDWMLTGLVNCRRKPAAWLRLTSSSVP